jgi:putative hemolysin
VVVVELYRLPEVDNPDYVFKDPGTPARNEHNGYCSHCHVRQVVDWVDHPHALAASNPVVHDVYAGTASVLGDQDCVAAGGVMQSTRQPGGGTHDVCVLGDGTLPDLNPSCGAPCDVPEETGACADCHAPGIDGELGGRDLLEATGIAYEHGVHCDVCHKVQDVDLEAPAGVAGRLQLLRTPLVPGEEDAYEPLNFAPLPDVLNISMGSVHSPLHREALFCSGCHELDQGALVPGTSVDTARWPDGVFPVHSTYSEWREGPLEGVAPCQACHMPPDAQAGNSADIDLLSTPFAGWTGGWWRPAGSVRRHVWAGPRFDEADMLALAVTLELDVVVDADGVTATTTVRQNGAGHAVPTGEPLRALVLTVDAVCDGVDVPAQTGPAVPAFVGALEVRTADQDWVLWPDAAPGDVLRVVRDEGWVDYAGFGPFGDGRFSAEEKGLADLRVVGASTVLEVTPDGIATLSAPLAEGDLVFRGRSQGADAQPLAGAPGFAFARVLADADGRRMVPHHRAVDVVSDNRILPGSSWATVHTFDAACAEPSVTARLTYRAYPWELAEARGWDNADRVVHEVTR